MTDPRRRIPSVDRLLDAPEVAGIVDRAGRGRVVAIIRDVQREARETMGAGAGNGAHSGSEGAGADRLADPAWYADVVAERLAAADRASVRRVINATGVVLHTNLGRAPLAEAARQAVAEAAGYASLEVDLATGDRSSRHDHCDDLLRELTGAESTLVVNNNAAAVVLALNTLASGREAVVSRGELVEIGGSFRVPEIMERSGARLREVGATNRTHEEDYAAALGPATGVVLKVHRSNFRIEGFTADVDGPALARIAAAADVPLVMDLGSGLLVDLSPFGLPAEPTARTALQDGADVVTLSGDKLLGGPQAGIILGRHDLVARMRANPLSRALRPDKLTLAALEATLRLQRDPDQAVRSVPVLRMLVATRDQIEPRARALAGELTAVGCACDVVGATSAVGGGAFPGTELPTTAVAVTVAGWSADDLARALRLGDPPVVARVREGRLLLDPRTIDPAEEPDVVAAFEAILRQGEPDGGRRAAEGGDGNGDES